jgi:RNA polymerase sigma factor (sigma-70 family)
MARESSRHVFDVDTEQNDDAFESWDDGFAVAPPLARIDGKVDSADSDLERVRVIVDNVLRRVLGGTSDPEYEDLVQSSIENVLATLDKRSFRGDCPLDGWAASIARNIAVDALRARSRDRRVFSHGEDDQTVLKVSERGKGPEHLAEVNRQLRQFEGALSKLRPNKAAVVYLHDVLGYDLAEVAATIGTSVAAAQSRLVRGRREIIDCMSAPTARAGAAARRKRSTTPAGRVPVRPTPGE